MNQRQKSKIQEYLAYFKENSWDHLPYSMQVDSGKPGKHIVFVTSLRGDEIAGVIALIKLHKFLKKNSSILNSGKITIILGNAQALRQDTAFLHEDLNTLFTDKDSQSYEGKRASTLKQFFVDNSIDIILDLHTARVGEMRMIQYRAEQMPHISIMEAISDISYYASYQKGLIPGSLVSYLTDQGLVAFGVECGNSKSKKSIGIAFDHLVRTLEYFEMVEPKLIPKMMDNRKVTQIQLFDVREAIKPGYNFRFTNHLAKTGSPIKKGEIYATFDRGHLVAHEDYFLFLPNKQARAGDQNAGFLCKVYKFKKD